MRFERCLPGVLATAAALSCAGDALVSQAVSPAAAMSVRPSGSVRPPAVCFAPGTDPAYVEEIYASTSSGQASSVQAPGGVDFQFDPNDRWTQTATNAPPLPRGAPTTLTWSVVPDTITFIPSAGFPGDVGANSNLRARLNQIYGNQATWQPLIQQALDEWATETGTRYVFEPNDDGAAFASQVSLGALGQLGVRGDLRLGGRNIDGSNGVLAFNWFPDSGDMVIDTNDAFFNTVSNGSLRLRNVVSHEHGHGLGFNHVVPAERDEADGGDFADGFVGPQLDDILAGHRGYGDDRENNDTTATGSNLGTLPDGTVPINGISLDGSNDLDFFRFTVPAGKQIDVVATPVGITYPEAGTNQKGSCQPSQAFNALAQVNLALLVLSSDGTTVLASTNTQPLGAAEFINNLVLPGTGPFFVRVSGSPDSVQLYNFSLTVEGGQAVDLGITKTDSQASAVPGQAATYTIVATNLSSTTTATGATVTDTFPPTFTSVTWSCVASVGSSCIVASGTGNISRTVNLAPGGTVTFTATGTVASTATGTLVNTALVAPPAGFSDPVAANNSATDSDTLTPQANLGITKTNAQGTTVPGTAVTYTIAVTNAGPSAAIAAPVADTFPASLSGVSWSCTATPGSSCAAPAGAGNIATTVTVLPAGTVTFSATGTVSPTATGTLANTATVTAPGGVTDPNATNNSATDTDTLAPTADLAVTKTDGQASEVPGTPVTYTIAVSNAGPSASGAATVTDTFPASLAGVTWTCSATPGSTCPASGVGNIAASVSLAPAGVATFTATGTIAASATGTLVNTATVAAPGGVTDPTPGNNSATDTDTLTPQADFGITKTDGQLAATPGAGVTYTIQVSQAGPSQSPAATVTDTFPAAITGVSWTCTASAGSSCPASGSGNINAAVTLLPGGTATFSATGTVSPAATGSLSNTAQVAAPGAVTDPVPGNNAATDTDNISLDITELTHGSRLVRDLRPAGVTPAEHFYWLSQKPFSSYEALVDATSGDVAPALELDLVEGDGSTVSQPSQGVSALGSSRRLTFINNRPVAENGQLLRVRSGGCGTNCGADDVYRVQLRDTTGRIPRYNNSTSQFTIVVLQNRNNQTTGGSVHFWRSDGTLLASQGFTIPAHGSVVVNSSILPGLAGTSGSVSVAHDGGYGGIAGKTVALEPATGFSFDSPLVPVAP